MAWLIGGLVVAVVLLARKASMDPANANPTGAPNGVPVDGTTPNAQSVPANNALPYLGATGAPSPFTGLGAPGASDQYKEILFMQNGPGGSRLNAFIHSPVIKGTGLLDPLPDKGTRSKELLTKDVVVGPGRKL